MTSYTHKLNAFTPRKTWTVEVDGLHWQEEEKEMKSGVLKWNNIRSVRLRYEPSRAETRRVAMHIHAPVKHTITNIHYGGMMNFKLQKSEFRRFVEDFHAAIPDTAHIEFHSGSTKGAYIGNALVSLGILIFLLFLAPIMSITGIPGATSIFRIIMILIFLPILAKVLIKNKPAIYTPDQLPGHMV